MTNTASYPRCGECGRSLVEGPECLHCAMQQALEASMQTPEPGDDMPPLGITGFASLADPVLPLATGRFLLLSLLGEGGMGVVYEAVDTKLNRSVALKLIRAFKLASAEERRRFDLEAQAAARLDHPHIVPVYEAGELDAHPFLVMKLIRGETLADRLTCGAMPAETAAEIIAKIASAVQHAHDLGVLHRDLKPSNILLDEAGESWLTDFGMARVGDSRLTMTAGQIGTPQYMAPEQAGGRWLEVDTRTDVWALGAVLYQMLSGRLPYEGESSLAVMHHVTANEPPRLKVSSAREEDLAWLVQRCLQKDRSQRLGSAGLLAEELGRWARHEPLLSRASPRTFRRKALLWVASFVVMVLSASYFIERNNLPVIHQEALLMPPEGKAAVDYGRCVSVQGDVMVVGAPGSGTGSAYVYQKSDAGWRLQTELTPEHGHSGDEFGRSVAISGDYLMVGAPGDSAEVANSGAVYVYERRSAGWQSAGIVKAAQPGEGDGFGRAVAIHGSTLVVGARLEEVDQWGDAGAVHVFERRGGSWLHQARLTSPNPGMQHLFGISVCVQGDTLLVGADGEGIMDAPSHYYQTRHSTAGAAYIFTRRDEGAAWLFQAKLLPALGNGGCFGYAVALSGNTALIGAYREHSSTAGINPTPDLAARESGAAFVFVRQGSEWTQQAFLKPHNSGAGSRFGFSLSLQNDTALISAYTESSASTGVNGIADNRCSESGAAYVFSRAGTQWSQTAYLKADTVRKQGHFGIATAMDAGTIVVGAPDRHVPDGHGGVWIFRGAH